MASQLMDFALTDWKAEPALPAWKSPTSPIGRVWGRIQGYAALYSGLEHSLA